MNLSVLADRVFVETSPPVIEINGLVLPDIAKKNPNRGIVVAVGPGKQLENGTHVALNVKKGDTVLFNSFGGEDVEVNGKKLKVLRENEILAKLVGEGV